MMKLVKLTAFGTVDCTIYVNPDQICVVQLDGDGDTEIYTSDGNQVIVRESLEETVALLRLG